MFRGGECNFLTPPTAYSNLRGAILLFSAQNHVFLAVCVGVATYQWQGTPFTPLESFFGCIRTFYKGGLITKNTHKWWKGQRRPIAYINELAAPPFTHPTGPASGRMMWTSGVF